MYTHTHIFMYIGAGGASSWRDGGSATGGAGAGNFCGNCTPRVRAAVRAVGGGGWSVGRRGAVSHGSAGEGLCFSAEVLVCE